jgi:pimeloyl-[acyl-carrier protein] synthase
MSDEYDLHGAGIFADPYVLYHQLRSKYPVHLDSHLGCWVVTSYSDVSLALANRNLSSERAIGNAALRDEEWNKLNPLFADISNLMFFMDPPRHTQLRSLINKAFSARMIEKWRASIQTIVNDQLDLVQCQGGMDIIRDIAIVLPMQAISDMLGIPIHNRNLFKRWSEDLAYFLGNPPTIEHCTQLMHSIQAFMEYFREIVIQHRTHPKDDLVDALLRSEDKGIALTENELLVNCVGLFAGGHETTTNLIGNGLLALLCNPEELQRLQKNPSLIESAVEECLRYDCPVQFTARVAKQTTEIGGKKIYRGQRVMLMLGAANRDPLQFDEPDHFDIGRRDNWHLAFGHNIHYCVGAALARLEAQVAIGTIVQRFPHLQLEDVTLEWQQNLSFHGLKALPVVF